MVVKRSVVNAVDAKRFIGLAPNFVVVVVVVKCFLELKTNFKLYFQNAKLRLSNFKHFFKGIILEGSKSDIYEDTLCF